MTPHHPDIDRALPILVAGFLFAMVVVLLVTPLVRRYMRTHGIVDRPEARRVNTRVIARAGGIAVAFGFFVVSLAMLAINSVTHSVDAPYGIGSMQIAALLAGGVLAAAIGLLDDLYQLRARYQFIGQFAIAFFAVAMGISVKVVNLPFLDNGTWQPGPIIGAVVTVVWIVALINSLNFIDGLDGLSSGIGLIAALTLAVFSMGIGSDEPYVALFCLILAGALAGFLRWNFHPATIFTGTSGIVFLGYTLAVLSISGAAKVAVALLVLGVPIMDTFWIIVRRLANRRSPFAADRGHIHHRLLDLGLSHRGTVLTIYAVCVLLSGLSFVLSVATQMYAFLGLVILFGLMLLGIEKIGGGVEDIEESLDADSYGNGDAADEDPAGQTAETPDLAVATSPTGPPPGPVAAPREPRPEEAVK